MFATQSVELPRPTYTALWEYLKQQGRQWEIPSILAEAVELWMAQQQANGAYGSWSYGEHICERQRRPDHLSRPCRVSESVDPALFE